MHRFHPRPAYVFLALSLAAPAVLAAQPQPFVGTVVYEASAGGPNTEGAGLFNGLGPQRESVTWGSGGKLRLETRGGLLEGIIVARMADSAFFQLDTVERVAHPATFQSLNIEDIHPSSQAFMRQQFGYPEMERLDEEGRFAGHPCRMYRVVRGGMLRRGATARMCIAEHIRNRTSRYSFEWNNGIQTVMASLPVQFGAQEGLPLMLEVNENNTIVTYRAVEIIPGEPDDALFSVPAGYSFATPRTDGS